MFFETWGWKTYHPGSVREKEISYSGCWGKICRRKHTVWIYFLPPGTFAKEGQAP